MIRFLLAIVSLLTFAISSSSAVVVLNHSFEDPVLAEGAITVHQTSPGVPSWTVFGAAPDKVGIINLDEGGVGANPDYMGAADGQNVLWMNEGFIGVLQMTSEQIKGQTTYTAKVAVSWRYITSGPLAGEYANGHSLYLLAGNTIIANGVNLFGTSGTAWVDTVFSVYVPANSPHIGEPLGIMLTVSGEQPLFDNVRIESVTVPEPGSLVLLCVGSLLLLGKWRRMGASTTALNIWSFRNLFYP